MDDSFGGELAQFQEKTTLEERKRWRPLYLMMKRKERQLRVERTELRDKDGRAVAVIQYDLIQELLAVTPHQWTAAERRRIRISTGEKEMPPGIVRVDVTRIGKKR